MNIFRNIFILVFAVLWSSVSYSADRDAIESALSKYCIGCKVSADDEQVPVYTPSKTDKPTMCGCDTSSGYVYNTTKRVCKLCENGSVATTFAVDCQPIVCPRGTYRAEVAKWNQNCPRGSYQGVLINQNTTYIK